MYAAGKIPGSFFKREGRAGEKGTLTARMIDRPLRPLFPKGWRYETQLVSIPMSIDHVHPYDILAMNGASAGADGVRHPVPHPGRSGADREGRGRQLRRQPDGGGLLENTDLDLVVAGTEEAILMVEAGANEIPEAEILDALDIAHGEIQKLCEPQRELAAKAGKQKIVVEVAAGRRGRSPSVKYMLRRGARRGHPGRGQARPPGGHQDGREGGDRAARPATPTPEENEERRHAAQMAFDKLEKDIIRERIAVHKKRPDGRGADEIRAISIEVGVAPRTHGSALFTRGQTQALSVVALGTTREEMRLDTLGLADDQALLPPLQLPAVLGRGGGLHARPQAPRHRPRRARRAGARADHPRRRRSSRTRSASSPTSSSPTARRRWPRCAARRCR